MAENESVKNKLFKRVKAVLIPAFFLTFSLLVFAPLNQYYLNAEITPFQFSARDIIPYSLILFAAGFISLLAVSMFFSDRFRPWFISILSAWGISAYIEGNYLNYGFGLLDGQTIDWNGRFWQGFSNTALWFGIFAVCLLLTKKRKGQSSKIFSVVVLFLICVQLSTLGYEAITIKPKTVSFQISDQNMMELSENRNVIVFVLDTFPQEVFSEILDEQPEIESDFKGFTFFPDTLGAFPFTNGAVPQILTGIAYDNSVPYTEYIDTSWKKAAFHHELKKLDYDISYYTDPTYLSEAMKGDVSNLQKVVMPGKKAYDQLVRLSLFSYSPFPLKRFFWFYPSLTDSAGFNWMTSNEDFYAKLNSEGIHPSYSKNCYHFYHLRGVHIPWYLNEDLKQTEDKVTIQQQGTGVIKAVREFLRQLREQGLYDDSAVVILADHSFEGFRDNPLFLVKPAGAKGDLHTSDKAVSYFDDLQPVLLSLLTENEIDDLPITEKEGRQRYFWYMSAYLPDIIEYSSVGKAWNPECMKRTGKILSPGNTETQDAVSFSWGSDINPGILYSDCLSGKGMQQPDGAWVVGKSCTLKFKVDDLDGKDAVLQLLITDKAEIIRHMLVKVNGRQIADVSVSDEDENIKIKIPADLIHQDDLSLTLEFPEVIQQNGEIRTVLLKNISLYSESNIAKNLNMQKSDTKNSKGAMEEILIKKDSSFLVKGWGFIENRSCEQQDYYIEVSNDLGAVRTYQAAKISHSDSKYCRFQAVIPYEDFLSEQANFRAFVVVHDQSKIKRLIDRATGKSVVKIYLLPDQKKIVFGDENWR